MGKVAGSVLLGPDAEKLETFYSSLSREGREGYDAILSTSISTVLSSVTFIAEARLDDSALRNCGELCSYLPLRPGDMVFEQGEQADAFCIHYYFYNILLQLLLLLHANYYCYYYYYYYNYYQYYYYHYYNYNNNYYYYCYCYYY